MSTRGLSGRAAKLEVRTGSTEQGLADDGRSDRSRFESNRSLSQVQKQTIGNNDEIQTSSA